MWVNNTLQHLSSSINLRTYVRYYTKKFNNVTAEVREGFENSRSEGNITCNYQTYAYIGESNGVTGDLFMQRIFPHKWLKEWALMKPKQRSKDPIVEKKDL